MAEWGFYGRTDALGELRRIVQAKRWFFCRIEGRRRIGKTTLLSQLARESDALDDSHDAAQTATVIGRLVNNYNMVEKLQPIFSDRKSRNARYYIADNFLQAWLSVAKPTREAARLRPLEKTLVAAIPRLQTLEGVSFEKLVRSLHVEMSRKGLGDFELSELKLGYWNRPRDLANSIEIDLVALDEPNRRIRFGSCKRTESAHDSVSVARFEKHVHDFPQVREHRHLAEWKCEHALFAPEFSIENRETLTRHGYRCLDLKDYAVLV